MIEVHFEIEAECSECGRGLTASFSNGMITVEPCDYCLRKKREEGLNEEREERNAEVAGLNAEIAKLEEEIEDLIERANQ